MPANAGRLWHDEHMLPLARALVGVASDVLRLLGSFVRSSKAIRAETLVLRKQLASYLERGIKARRVNHVLTSASQCFRDSSIGAMRSSSYDRRPSFAGTEWAGGSSGGTNPARTAAHSAGTATAYSPDGRRESVVGRREDCQ